MPQLVDNRYRIVRSLGSGGMADVYLAHDDVLDRDVALKIMSSGYASDEEFVERFRREAQSAAALSHPNIVSIYDRGETDEEPETYYIAMEYLPGGSLKDRIEDKGALPARTSAEVALQIAEALKAAHERDVVHRDIKPHNILITESGDLKVTDFGIARAATSSTMTRTGSILGTAHYISPEQAMGEPVGPQSDLYSLGVVLYETLTGGLPFDAESPIGIAMKHVNAYPTPPSQLDPSIPEGLDAITLRLMSKDPEDRYPDESELINDLERVISGLSPSEATTMVLAGATAPLHRPPQDDAERTIVSAQGLAAKRQRRRRRLLPLLLLGGLALLALLGWGGYSLLNPQAATAPAPELEGLSLQEARERYGEGFSISVSDRQESREPENTILSQDPAAGSELERGSGISVVVSGQRVAEVPDVVGESQEEAARLLSEDGFEVSVQTEESSASEEGNVVSQSPSGGEEADFESEVTITVGGGPSEVGAPDLSGMSVSEAEAALSDAGLELGAVEEAASDEAAEGEIFAQSPAADSQVEAGSAVDVTVSSGPEQVSVPNLYGYNVANAEAALANAGLELGAVEEAETNQVAEGVIFEQSQAAGTLAEPGEAIDVTVSSGPAQIEVPGVVGQNIASAQQTLLNAGLGYISQGVVSDEPAGTVISADPPAGTALEPGTQVLLSYSLGPPEPAPQPASGSGGGGFGNGGSGGGNPGGSGSGADLGSVAGPGSSGSGSNSGGGSSGGSGNGGSGGGSGSGGSGGSPGGSSGGGPSGRSSGGGSSSGVASPQPPDIEAPEPPEQPDVEAPEPPDLPEGMGG